MPPQVKKRKAEKPTEVEHLLEESTGNVFEDLGIPDPDDALAKAHLAHRICQLIAARKLTQVKAAAILEIDQPKVSALMRGKLDGFSTDRLMRFLNLLGQEVEIVLRPVLGPGRPARTRVVIEELGAD